MTTNKSKYLIGIFTFLFLFGCQTTQKKNEKKMEALAKERKYRLLRSGRSPLSNMSLSRASVNGVFPYDSDYEVENEKLRFASDRVRALKGQRLRIKREVLKSASDGVHNNQNLSNSINQIDGVENGLKKPEKNFSLIVEAPVDEGIEELAQMNSGTFANIYFDYKSSNIKTKYKPQLMKSVEWFLSHPNTQILIAGHTDEIGSNSYNLQLGEERANSVLEYFISSGANPEQLTSISYGEEIPQKVGKNEDDYALNRRVEFHVQTISLKERKYSEISSLFSKIDVN